MAKTAFSVRVDPDLYARAKALADQREWSLSHWVGKVMARAVEGEEGKQTQRPARRSGVSGR